VPAEPNNAFLFHRSLNELVPAFERVLAESGISTPSTIARASSPPAGAPTRTGAGARA